MAICNCDQGFNNTGTPSCLFAPDLASRIFIVPKNYEMMKFKTKYTLKCVL